MNREIEYHELIEKIIPKNALENFIYDLKETYRSEYGWAIGETKTEIINKDDIKISVEIIKYKITEESISKSR